MGNKAIQELMVTLPLDSRFPVNGIIKEVAARTETSLHQHDWNQLVFSDTGVVQVTTPNGMYWVPPQNAVWIPSCHTHSAVLLERAKLFSVYFLPTPALLDTVEWHQCQCFEVSALLGELLKKMATTALEAIPESIYQALCQLIYAEIEQSELISMAVPMPSDKRLLHLCQLFLRTPRQSVKLYDLAAVVGASESTIRRLFKAELNMTFSQWRQQALLACAITLSANKMPIGRIALELGYSSHSAFTAMVTSVAGRSPKLFFDQ
ncbi:helix-turn-helix transcriptional regulator [Endozoicomonas sp. Mp262]|uniref:AraC family transcriptional regulator n=1 Tax=Endozoicomonas sp. Mp262 TaxID=2919499 RepID=UPI0021D937FC